MKLAEALILRAEYKASIDNLERRILANLKIQDGSKANESSSELLNELKIVNKNLSEIIKQINQANFREQLADGRTLAEALVEREGLMKERRVLANIVSQASAQDYRVTRTELKMNLTLNVGEIQKNIDQLSKDFRVLDTEIQGKNWLVDL